MPVSTFYQTWYSSNILDAKTLVTFVLRISVFALFVSVSLEGSQRRRRCIKLDSFLSSNLL